MADAPEFDPSKPFETVNSAPEFDPSKPHEIVGGKPTWGEVALDVGKQVATSPVRVAEGLATGPAQLLGLAGQGANYLTTGKAEQPSPNVTGWEQKLRNFGHGIFPQIFQTAEGQERPLQELVAENKGPYGLDLGSGSKGINQYLPQPETKLGEYGRTITDMTLAGAAQPGSTLRKAAEGAGAGLASEAAGQATKGTELEPYARMAGALVGGYPVAKAAQVGQDIRRAAKTPTGVELHDASDAAYKAARGMRVQYDEHATLALERNIQRDLLSEGYRPGAGMSTFDRIEELTATPQTKNPTFADIEGVRKALNKVAGERSPAPPFGPTPNASAAMRAIDHIDDFLADSTNAARGYEGAAKRAAMLAEEGRGNWAAMRRSETIEHAANKGELEAAAAGSGANIENRLRAQIKNILVSPKKSRGFTPEDRVIMRDMVKGDFSRNSARLLGKMAMTGIVSAGGVQYLASTMGLGALGHIFLPVAGHISKKIGDISMRHAYRNLAANLRAASPLGQSRNIPEIGLPPSGKAALLRAEVAGQEGFRKGGRVTKTFRYRQAGGPTGEGSSDMFAAARAQEMEPPPPPSNPYIEQATQRNAALQATGNPEFASQPSFTGVPLTGTPFAQNPGLPQGVQQRNAALGQDDVRQWWRDMYPAMNPDQRNQMADRLGYIDFTRALYGLPMGADMAFSDTAESGAPSAIRRVAPGNAIFGHNIWDAVYLPGAPIAGYTRWPAHTNVKRGGRINGLPSIR